jgi:hypothetical protein
MELGHLPYKKGTYEDYVGREAFEERGKKKWRRDVADVVGRLIAALQPDDVVLGGGNAKELKQLPPNCRVGNNANAFSGGFRLWEQAAAPQPPLRVSSVSDSQKKRKENGYGSTRGTNQRKIGRQTSSMESARSTS